MTRRKLIGVVAVLAVVVAAIAIAAPRDEAAADPALDAEEARFVELINNYRTQNGLGELIVNFDQNEAADWLSADMGQKGYFSHTDSLGRGPAQRLCDFGYCYGTWAENIFAGGSTADQAFNAWRNSPGHNTNMLRNNMRVMGIARVFTAGSTYGWYWTNDFGGVIPPADSTPPPTQPPTAPPTAAPTVPPTSTAAPVTPTPFAPTASVAPTPTLAPTATAAPPTASPTFAPTATVMPPVTDAPTEPPPTFSPVATPMEFIWGDSDCDGELTSRDSQALLRIILEQPPLEPSTTCPDIGANFFDGARARLWGDLDCDEDLTSRDSQALLRMILRQPGLGQTAGCPVPGLPIGS
jgi:uncharacterized protein YkwD